MAKKGDKEERAFCPVGRFFQDLEESLGKDSPFFEHLNQSRVEFLKAVRALVDETIGGFEKKRSRQGKKKMTKIEVE
jgi:hypothetical protein